MYQFCSGNAVLQVRLGQRTCTCQLRQVQHPEVELTHCTTSQFLTPLMLCVLILYMSGGTYSLKSTPNDRFFEKLFHGHFIYSQSFCQKSAEGKSPKKYFLYFVLMSGLGLEPCLYVQQANTLPTRLRLLQYPSLIFFI